MRVFVAGATGAVGSRLTRLLVSSGHSVVGLTRIATEADAIVRVGAEVSVADALNRAALVAAVTGAKPDVIVHEMTAISAANDLRRFDRSFAATNRLRSQGLDNLLAAAKQAGTPRVIAQSFCRWPPCPHRWCGQIGGPSSRLRPAASDAPTPRSDPARRAGPLIGALEFCAERSAQRGRRR